jgi:hypothetical protein
MSLPEGVPARTSGHTDQRSWPVGSADREMTLSDRIGSATLTFLAAHRLGSVGIEGSWPTLAGLGNSELMAWPSWCPACRRAGVRHGRGAHAAGAAADGRAGRDDGPVVMYLAVNGNDHYRGSKLPSAWAPAPPPPDRQTPSRARCRDTGAAGSANGAGNGPGATLALCPRPNRPRSYAAARIRARWLPPDRIAGYRLLVH